MVCASGEFLPSLQRTFAWVVLTLGVVFVADEVVLVLFQHVPRIQLARSVLGVDSEGIIHAEIDTYRPLARCVFDRNLFFADDVQLSLVAVPYATHLLDVLDFSVGASLVLWEDEV